MTTRKMISASRALEVMLLPQVGPTNVTFMLPDGTWNAACRAPCTLSAIVVASWPVVTRHWCGPLRYWEVELPPPALLTTREMAPWADGDAGNSKTEPPLNSTLKFSPRTASATALTSTMRPEIVYHMRWRPTMLTEMSPRYSRPGIWPRRVV